MAELNPQNTEISSEDYADLMSVIADLRKNLSNLQTILETETAYFEKLRSWTGDDGVVYFRTFDGVEGFIKHRNETSLRVSQLVIEGSHLRDKEYKILKKYQFNVPKNISDETQTLSALGIETARKIGDIHDSIKLIKRDSPKYTVGLEL